MCIRVGVHVQNQPANCPPDLVAEGLNSQLLHAPIGVAHPRDHELKVILELLILLAKLLLRQQARLRAGRHRTKVAVSAGRAARWCRFVPQRLGGYAQSWSDRRAR